MCFCACACASFSASILFCYQPFRNGETFLAKMILMMYVVYKFGVCACVGTYIPTILQIMCCTIVKLLNI